MDLLAAATAKFVSGNVAGTCPGCDKTFTRLLQETELSQRVLGSERLTRGRANCTVRSHTFEQCRFFEGMGDQFFLYASRLRVRGFHSHRSTRERAAAIPAPARRCSVCWSEIRH